MKTVAIIGGGAAGLACAVELRRLTSAFGHAVEIAIYESTDKIGRSILASGNGRCNFSNAHIDPAKYWNPDFADRALCAFEDLMGRHNADHHVDHHAEPDAISPHHISSHDADHHANPDDAHNHSRHPYINGVVSFFEQLGLVWREEGEGRLYPLANKASVVLDVLRAPLTASQDVHSAELQNNASARSTSSTSSGISEISPDIVINVKTDSSIMSIDPPHDLGARFTLRMQTGELFRANFVVVACGGHTLAELLPPEIAFREMHPVLCPLATTGNRTRKMDNIRVRCVAHLLNDGHVIASERGEVMFRKYGLSGIAVFNLSRFAERGNVISLDLMPDMNEDELIAVLRRRAADLRRLFGSSSDTTGDLTNERFMCGLEAPQVNDVILADCDLDPSTRFVDASVPKIAHALKHFDFEVEDKADPQHAQCHRGGFAVEDIDAHTMQSNDINGLYIAGEALDVDGPCGGYNLYWAFSTGILAAHDIAARLDADARSEIAYRS